MQQYNIRNILQSGEKVAVHVPTEDEAKIVYAIVEPSFKFDGWHYKQKDTCINLQGNFFDSINYYKKQGFTIIPASLFIQHNTLKVEKKPFAVKADSFELYERFKADVEKMGWRYNYEFTDFDEVQFRNNDCFYFSNEWDEMNGDRCFSFTNAGDAMVYHLETQYPEAIAAAKAWFEGQEVKAEECKYKALHETMSKEAERLQSLLRNTERELSELKTKVKLLLKHNKDQHDRNNAKLMAVSILLSSFPLQATHRQKQFSVDCIKQHIEELIEKEYDEPGALPF